MFLQETVEFLNKHGQYWKASMLKEWMIELLQQRALSEAYRSKTCKGCKEFLPPYCPKCLGYVEKE